MASFDRKDPKRFLLLVLGLAVNAAFSVAAFPRTMGRPVLVEVYGLRKEAIGSVAMERDDYKERTKKVDLFLDDFVPTEYTGYRVNAPRPRPRHSRARSNRHKRQQLADVDHVTASDFDLIEKKVGILDRFSNISVKTDQRFPETTSEPAVTTTQLNAEELQEMDLEQLRQKLSHYIRNVATVDPQLKKLFLAFNTTLSKPHARGILLAFLKMLEGNEDLTNEIQDGGDSSCEDFAGLKILPDDPEQVVRLKYATKMKCYMNETVNPCDRFYDYACGRWDQYHPIPKDLVGYDIFEILREEMDAKLIRMLTEPADESDSNSTLATKLLYASCMNEDAIEMRKEAPLKNLLKELGGWPVVEGDSWQEQYFSWEQTVATLRQFNNDILIAVWVGPDIKDSEHNIVQFDQSDLMLPSAEYYQLGFNHPIIQTYYNILVKVSTMLGASPDTASKEMEDLITFETNLANIMIPPHERRNYSEIYTKLSLADLQKEIPEFDFSSYLDKLLPRKLEKDEQVVMYALTYFKKLTALLSVTENRTVANYVLWRFIRYRLKNLDRRYRNKTQDLIRRLYGREETPPRWKFCVAYVRSNLGNAVGSLFVRKYFDERSKKDMEDLTEEVQAVFQNLVLQGTWLSNDTKKLAAAKIQNIIHSIGYPDFILDDAKLQKEIENLTYHEDEFFQNVLQNLRSRTVQEMSQLDTAVNRTHWTATPAEVNAFYSRNRNQIMFPAGILQPPFYHKHFPKSLNFGGIGVVIGHEITHGFDDKGRQFDHEGNINHWWDHESSENFYKKALCIITQYGSYRVEEVDIFLNGLNTQGENIADNGGIKQSYYAYKNTVNEEPSTDQEMPGLEHLSPDQLFFLNFAQVWCGSTRREFLQFKLKTAVHAPGKYRVLGTLSNSEEFAKAFNCPSTSRMNPVGKCSVW